MATRVTDLRPDRVTPVALSALAAEVGAEYTGDVDVSGVSVTSSDICAGDLFIAVPGEKTHGAAFAAQAVRAGAVAVLTDPVGAERVRRDCPGLPLAIVDHPRHVEGTIAARVYGDPSAHLRVLGVTGTNGKTTTAFLMHALLSGAGEQSILQSTGVQRVGDDEVYTSRTTAEAPVLHALMAAGLERGMEGAVLEVSAHAVSLERICGVRFDAVGFTNLQHDHLDYYGDMEHYYRAKAGLFAPEHAARGVVCVDDAWGRRLASEARIPIVTVATRGGDADVTATRIAPDPASGGTRFTLVTSEGEVDLFCPLPGSVNVQNAAVAALTAHEAGLGWDQIGQALAVAPQVPGRMETILSDHPEDDPLVIVDYAHTPEALELILPTARDLTRGRLHLVFGTDGDRDATKRPGVGRAAAEGADVLWVTDENPRTEPAQVMRDALLAGIREVRPDLADVTEVTTCRRDAIRQAIMSAGPDDTVLITGKGAEAVQEIDYCMHPFRDQDVARECFAGRALRRALTARIDAS